MAVKRVLCIQDMSGVGRSSMAVSLPVISAMGVQACALPTALLSTHTGGFGAVAYMDETFFAREALSHYKAQGIGFDAVYSGYLCGKEQVRLVARCYEDNPAAFRVMDPAMADGGRLYSNLPVGIVAAMQSLAAKAQLIIPNATEARLLLGEDAGAPIAGRREIERVACALVGLGAQACVIKGVSTGENNTANLAYDGKDLYLAYYDLLPAQYPGTGDIFAAVLTAALVNGLSLPKALDKATAFAGACVSAAISEGAELRYGTPFEPLLNILTQGEQIC